MYNKFSSLIVDPEMSSRGKLRQAANNVHTFSRVFSFSNLQDGLDQLKSSKNCDIVFVSHHFEEKEIQEFINLAKATPKGQHSAYILVVKQGSQNKTTVANHILLGIDGLLFEPYSVDNLREIADIAAKVNSRNVDSKERAAIKLLVETIVTELNHITSLNARGKSIANSMKNLELTCQLISRLNEEAMDIYYDIMVEKFVRLAMPVQEVVQEEEDANVDR